VRSTPLAMGRGSAFRECVCVTTQGRGQQPAQKVLLSPECGLLHPIARGGHFPDTIRRPVGFHCLVPEAAAFARFLGFSIPPLGPTAPVIFFNHRFCSEEKRCVSSQWPPHRIPSLLDQL
jgi:hypothetical protein